MNVTRWAFPDREGSEPQAKPGADAKGRPRKPPRTWEAQKATVPWSLLGWRSVALLSSGRTPQEGQGWPPSSLRCQDFAGSAPAPSCRQVDKSVGIRGSPPEVS